MPLNQPQFDALTSYVYNTGSLKDTKLLNYLNNGNYTGASNEMNIITSGGEVRNGLKIRRNDEQNMFNYGIYRMH